MTNIFTFTSHCLLYTRHYFRSAFKVKVLVTQSCPALCDPMHCSSLGSSVQGILQARIQEWVAIPFSRGSSQPRYWTWVSRVAGRFLTIWATREASIDSLLSATIILKSNTGFFFPCTSFQRPPPSGRPPGSCSGISKQPHSFNLPSIIVFRDHLLGWSPRTCLFPGARVCFLSLLSSWCLDGAHPSISFLPLWNRWKELNWLNRCYLKLSLNISGKGNKREIQERYR